MGRDDDLRRLQRHGALGAQMQVPVTSHRGLSPGLNQPADSHTTTFDDGRIHATFTQTGTFVAVPLEDPSLPSFTGHFTIWGGFNQNGKTVNGTFTFTVQATGSDGSTERIHITDHFNVRPDGAVNEFFRCH
jgi:hypothetical protein